MVDEQDLKQDLDPALDYYDATPTLEQMLGLFKRHEEILQKQVSINLSFIATVKQLQERIDLLEGNGQKPKALILPPRMQ